ncbi:MAG: hypothetical protein AB7M12_03810 [Hyphomonadaceae bacterium]
MLALSSLSAEAQRLIARGLVRDAAGRLARDERDFTRHFAAAAAAPLIEIAPAAPGDAGAALGFALAWAQSGPPGGFLAWAAPDAHVGEHGGPCAEGLARFGLSLDRLLFIAARTQTDALWASEQALAAPGASALCTVAPGSKSLSLTATRRLLLAAEKHGARCALLRLDRLAASAAWMRWRIAAAASEAAGRELGRPAFTAHLERSRAGPSGLSWRLDWNANAHAFRAAECAVDGAVAAAPGDRPDRPGARIRAA